MGLGIYTYGTVARVQTLGGDAVALRVFATGTVPTLAEVESILDDIAAEIVMVLQKAQYTLETAANLIINQPRVHEYLRMLNSVGAAAVVLETLPSVAIMAGEEGEGGGRATSLRRRYLSGLKLIREGRLSATRSIVEKAWAGSAQDDEGNVKEPAFTRAMTDYPGVWTDEDDS